jgi:hypothetical protein
MTESAFSTSYNEQGLSVKQVRIKGDRSVVKERKSIYPVFCPAIDSDIDGMLRAEGFREGPPLAAVFADIADGVKELAGINFYISPLGGEQTDNVVSLLLG